MIWGMVKSICRGNCESVANWPHSHNTRKNQLKRRMSFGNIKATGKSGTVFQDKNR